MQAEQKQHWSEKGVNGGIVQDFTVIAQQEQNITEGKRRIQ